MKQPTKKRLRRAFLALLCAGLLLSAVPFVINSYMISYAEPYILTPEEAAQKQADCVLVLGAKVHADGTPSHMLEDRLQYGIDLYKAGAAPKLLCSGDHGTKGYDEVNSMKDFVAQQDVPREDVFMDHAGFSTYESMYRARDVFQAKTIIAVTQGYHLYRAVYIARKLGLEAWGVASDPRAYGQEFYHDSREFLARNKAFAMCLYKPEPTFLGEVIPISGSGEATDDRAAQTQNKT